MVMPGLGGLAVSDAFAHGVPVICGIGDGSEADLIDGTNGMILLPLNQTNLLDGLTRLYCDKALQISWRRNAMKLVLDKYNIGNYVDVIEKCVKSLLH